MACCGKFRINGFGKISQRNRYGETGHTRSRLHHGLIFPQDGFQSFDPVLRLTKFNPDDADHIRLSAVVHCIARCGRTSATLLPSACSFRCRSRKLRFIGRVFGPVHVTFLRDIQRIMRIKCDWSTLVDFRCSLSFANAAARLTPSGQYRCSPNRVD
jgi:hypothetical protein